MSLVTYADLQTQVANWLARTDLNAYIPDMITLFEAKAARKLKVRPMQATTTLATTNGVGTLPTDYLGAVRVTWTGTYDRDLDYVHPSEFIYTNPFSDIGDPLIYTVEGSSIKVAPIDDSGLQLVYYQKAGALASALNWLWTSHPDAYLYGTLAEANYFNKGSALPMAQTWETKANAVFDEIQMLNFREPGNLSMRVMTPTP